MKTKSTRNIFALALILFTVLGCGRYEDGPCISFNSVQNRIEGKWMVQEFLRNDQDVTNEWNEDFAWTFHIYCPNGCYEGTSMTLGLDMVKVPNWICPDSALYFYNTSIFRFEDNYKIIVLFFNYYAQFSSSSEASIISEYLGFKPLISNTQIYFNIRKLTSEKLWLSANDNEIEYIIKLRKI